MNGSTPALLLNTTKLVLRVLEQLPRQGREPEWIVCDNCLEFAGWALAPWAYQHGVRLEFITPCKPSENGYPESFHGKLRDEYLNEHWFTSLTDMRETVEA